MKITDFDILINPKKRAAMKEAIEIAWSSEDPETKNFQNKYFPEGKPSIEHFILTMKKAALEEMKKARH